jgi:hypothetical protein
LSPGLHDIRLEAPGTTLGGPGWPRPLVLLCALLAGSPGIAGPAAARMTPDEWDAFSDLVISRHRVAPAIAESVRNLGVAPPDRVLRAIRSEARANGFAALAQKSESLRLAGMLDAAGVPAVWLKGWPLAEQLYGAAGLRHSNDIDFLVDPGARIAAARCLRTAGYVPAPEHRLRARLIGTRAVAAECKDVQYFNPESGLVAELHWRTSHLHGWPDLRDLDEPPAPLPGAAGAARILVPGPVGQLSYLATHGQQHLFSRLKWLLDIARLAGQRGPEQLGADLRAAQTAGAGSAVRLALHLAHRVFGAGVPAEALALAPPESRWARDILAQIADPGAAPGRPMARIGFYRWHLRMARTPAQFLGVLRFAIWRHLRLGLAGLARPVRGGEE